MPAALLDAPPPKFHRVRPAKASLGASTKFSTRVIRGENAERNPVADSQHRRKFKELLQHCGSVGNLALILSVSESRIRRARKKLPAPWCVACVAMAHSFIIGDGSAPLLDLDWIVENRLRSLRDEWRMKRWVELENKDGDGI